MSSCTLCDLPADPAVTDEAVDGEFCCRGCLEVSRTLGDVEIDELDEEPVATRTESGNEGETAYLAVDGMHCTSCELFLESVARDHDGIYDAEASYAAETIKLVYDPDRIDTETLPAIVSGMGYRVNERGADKSDGIDLQSRLLVGGLFGMMAMTWYAIFLYPTYFGFDPVVSLGSFDGAYLGGQLAVVTAIVLLYTGEPMLRGAYVSLRTRQPNVDLLVAIAAVAAYLYSTVRLFVGGMDLYYDVTIVVVLAVTVGNYYETRIKRSTAGLLADLTEQQVTEATRRNGETVAVADIDAGDELLVRPGERVPVDGTVVDGAAAVDESLVTGEPMPETKRVGEEVRGGSVVTDAPLVIEAGEGARSTLDRIVDLLWEIQATRPGAQRVADRLATVFVPLVLVLAVAVGLVFLLTGASGQTAVLVSLTVVIVSCPCALGLATPLAIASGLQSAADRGIVVTTPALFEKGDEIETVVFDKTGTITTGEMGVKRVITAEQAEDELLWKAAAIEQYSDHPIATAIVDAVDEPKSLPTGGVDTIEQYSRGIAGTVDERRILVGNLACFATEGWTVSSEIEQVATNISEDGAVPAIVGQDGDAAGVIAINDSPRTAWDECLQRVSAERRVVVLTGDDGPAASKLETNPAIDQVFAGVPPDGKAATVRRLQATETVAMVGDGSNDAPALASADVGIALDGGTQLATDAADAVALEGNVGRVPAVFEIAAGTNRRIKQNILWALCYNGIAIPLAMTGLLNPLFAALAMATSSLFVVGNSARDPSHTDRLTQATTATPDPRSESESAPTV